MLDERRIREIRQNMETFIKSGIIKKEKEKKFVQFFLTNAKNSLNVSNLLYNISMSENLKNDLGFPGFNGFLWVINSSYYSMFYMARALLENEGIKVKTAMSIHSIVFDALVYYFYLRGKIEKRMIEEFEEANEEAAEILGKERSKELIEEYYYEKRKRAVFTYDMGKIAMENKARTSLERSKRFNEEIRKIIEA